MRKFTKVISSLAIGGIYLNGQSPKDKTWEGINRKVEFNPPVNFKPNVEFEKSIENIITQQQQDVNVICLPKNFGTTTALKHVATKIQNEELKIPDEWKISQGYKNAIKDTNIKVVYIDGKTIKEEDKINQKWFYDNFGKDEYRNYIKTFPDNTMTLIILDHMSRKIIDGFLKSDDYKANRFYTNLAVSTHNDRKFVVIVTTNDASYAKDITTHCNGGDKLNLYSQLYHSRKWFDGLTHPVTF